MERRNLWLATGMTLLLLLAAGAFQFSKIGTPVVAQAITNSGSLSSAQVVEPQSSLAASELERSYAEREATYQLQIEQLNQMLLDRQSTYQAQIAELKSRFTVAQSQQEQVEAQEYTVQSQVNELLRIRNERQAMLQTQLQATTAEYDARYVQLTARLGEVQTKLAEANTLLNR